MGEPGPLDGLQTVEVKRVKRWSGAKEYPNRMKSWSGVVLSGVSRVELLFRKWSAPKLTLNLKIIKQAKKRKNVIN
jgi:hypothetical protein